MLSYWENNSFLNQIDLAIIGSGITGLSCAIHAKRKFPKLNVVILEQGMLPAGASTKNAGFACFGSIGELIDDLKTSSSDEIVQLVRKRKQGLDLIKNLLGEHNLGLLNHGGFELFFNQQELNEARASLDDINQLLQPIFKEKVFSDVKNSFLFGKTTGIIKNNFEAQIDTGLMMKSYLELAKLEGIQIFNGVTVAGIDDQKDRVELNLKNGQFIQAKKLVVCSNGFAQSLLENEDVLPARAQVLITKPIKNLHIEGTFHVDRGYYYFRNIHDRILLGGGRNLDVEGETTTDLGNTPIIMDSLKKLLTEVILPQTPFEIDYSWSGVMGVGQEKNPIVKSISTNVFCGVRLGGMGVALGTQVGKDCVDLLSL